MYCIKLNEIKYIYIYIFSLLNTLLLLLHLLLYIFFVWAFSEGVEGPEGSPLTCCHVKHDNMPCNVNKTKIVGKPTESIDS